MKVFIFTFILFSLPILSYSENFTMTVGLENYENFLPYSSYVDGDFTGIGRDIIDLFAKKQGYNVIYETYPLKRLSALYLNGSIDFLFPDNPSWNSEKKKNMDINYAHVAEFIDGVVVHKENYNREVSFISNLGIPLGFTPVPYVSMIKNGSITISTNSNYKILLNQLLFNRVQGIYVNIFNIYSTGILEEDKYNNLIFDKNLPYVRDFFSLSSYKYKNIIEDFKLFLIDNKYEIDIIKNNYNFYDLQKTLME